MNRKDEIKQFVNEFNDALGIYNDENDRKYKIEKFKEEFNKDLEKAYEEGKVKNIGISNFEDKKLEELCDEAKIKPVLNQVELHPYFQQKV